MADADDATVVADVQDLGFGYNPAEPPVVDGVTLRVRRGERWLVIGDNGAGKSTLLRMMAGRHMPKAGSVRVLGRSPDFDTALNKEITLLEPSWGTRTISFAAYGVPLQADFPVSGMMRHLQEEFPERRAKLMELLDIDPTWRMHKVSDGQRRRVQLFLGMLRPVSLLLLDEVTSDLDVVTRADLLQHLVQETEARGSAIVLCTHVFCGLEAFATHVAIMSRGQLRWRGALRDMPGLAPRLEARDTAPLMRAVEEWVRQERRRLRDDELSRQRRLATVGGQQEEAAGVRSTDSAGGFAPGRLARDAYNYWG